MTEYAIEPTPPLDAEKERARIHAKLVHKLEAAEGRGSTPTTAATPYSRPVFHVVGAHDLVELLERKIDDVFLLAKHVGLHEALHPARSKPPASFPARSIWCH